MAGPGISGVEPPSSAIRQLTVINGACKAINECGKYLHIINRVHICTFVVRRSDSIDVTGDG
jgi:hypothetical protein